MKNIYLFILLVVALSCDKKTEKKNCISEKIDAVFIKKYFVETDSCDKFQNYIKVNYYDIDNKKLLMFGYSNRSTKQGKWKFFDSNQKKVSEGQFKDSEPSGIWEFNELGTINWGVYVNLEKGFRISVPKEWNVVNLEKENTIGILNSSDLDKYDLKIAITSAPLNQLETELSVFIEETIKFFNENENIKKIQHKKLSLIDINESYEIQYEKSDNTGDYINKEYIYEFEGQIYIFSSSLRKNSNYDFKVIEEIIMSSYKMYEYVDENN